MSSGGSKPVSVTLRAGFSLPTLSTHPHMQPRALGYAEELFEKGDINKDSMLTVKELKDILVKV